MPAVKLVKIETGAHRRLRDYAHDTNTTMVRALSGLILNQIPKSRQARRKYRIPATDKK